MVNFLEGIIKISNIILSVIAGFFAISLFKVTSKKELFPWKILIIALVFFVIQEILGALRAFKIYNSPFLTHIIPTLILGLLIYALTLQIIHVKYKVN